MALEQAAQLPAADAQSFGELLHTRLLAVERAVGDQGQRPAYRVGGAAPEGEVGRDLGRQRRQGRNLSSWAAAADAKKRQFSNFGQRAGQIGRQ